VLYIEINDYKFKITFPNNFELEIIKILIFVFKIFKIEYKVPHYKFLLLTNKMFTQKFAL